VEFAVCLPVIALLVFASIEACTMIYLKQSLTIAAYEASRTAVRPLATTAEVTATCEQVLSDRQVRGAQVAVTPSDITAADVGTYLEIRVTAPCSDNMIGGTWFFGERALAGASAFMKEY
jgi:Flp pilus assembly protein TadG